ncbi:hypothetical protein D6C86_03571 [Aureobasidium pullulans]|uniref:Uncharacterized protein n=1 Tax=Aureobasidium pullulans TaxID=5580 RepID=A0A4S9WB97_AURPU|nr:hypothetical protein D6C94_03772 [Aureobasidium pullulans]THZ40464.1 hypothetical protein D6C87_06404 [Aureobasidium pullulans]THZ62702.1 hypothetical protein D6C86_03571 [Aureobasidium pullulans]
MIPATNMTPQALFEKSGQMMHTLCFLVFVCIICSTSAMVGLTCYALLTVPVIIFAMPCLVLVYALFSLAINHVSWFIVLVLLLWINIPSQEIPPKQPFVELEATPENLIPYKNEDQSSGKWQAPTKQQLFLEGQTPINEQAPTKQQVSLEGQISTKEQASAEDQAIDETDIQALWSRMELRNGIQRIKREGGDEQSWRDYHAKMDVPDSITLNYLEERFQHWRKYFEKEVEPKFSATGR